jgi:hypothetical protein
MEQTAVEWYEIEINLLIEKLEAKEISKRDFRVMKHNLFYPAKEIEKQQIIEAHFQGVKETVLNVSKYIDITKTLNTIQEIENGIGKHEEGEDYYNKTFKNK